MRHVAASLAIALSVQSGALGRAHPPAVESAVDIVRSHPELAAALARTVPLQFSDGRLITTGGIALDPRRASMRVGSSSGQALTITANDDILGYTLFDGGLTLVSGSPDTEIVEIATIDSAEEFRVLRSPAAPSTFRYHFTREGIAAVRAEADRLVALDASGAATVTASLPFAVDAKGARRTLEVAVDGDELVARLDTHDLAYPIVVDPEWKATAPMAAKRQFAAIVRLGSGKLLVSGGTSNGLDPVSSAETYDEATAKWTTIAPMKAARMYHAAVVMKDGRVLVAGGASSASPTAEIYDPATNVWTATPPMTLGQRLGPAGALLGDGRVLVAGGTGPTSTKDEVYDPTAKTWTATGLTDLNRMFHRATSLADGRVLITGGRVSAAPNYPRRIDIFDPKKNAYENSAGLGFLVEGRANHTATLLPDGRVLVAGGNDDAGSKNTAELYDPAANSWAKTPGAMVGKRSYHQAVRLETGDVLLMGGLNLASPALKSCELFDVKTTTFKPFASMVEGRVGFITEALPSGRVLAAGGANVDIDTGYTASAEIVAAFPAGKACTIASDCSSGFCVDGVCCDRACTEQCEACDVPGKPGTCVPIDGKPHGTRPACEAPGDACKARTCEGLKEVKFCASYVKGNTCAEAACSGESLVPAGTCDGAGSCATASPLPCAPYACAATACNSKCSTKSDCASGYFCKDSACVPEGASCSEGDRSSTGKDGKVTPCGAYRCGGDGLCATRCADSAVCAAGFVCDTTSSQCVAAPSAEDEGGCGCAVPGGPTRTAVGSIVAMAVALGLARRRRR